MDYTGRILKYIVPQERAARKATLLNFVPTLMVYITRILLTPMLGDFRQLYVLCIPICLIAPIIAVLIVYLAVISIRRAQHLTPGFVLLGGLMLSFFLPLPPLPLPVLPEETFFSAHRTGFEDVVTLARQNQLSCVLAECDSVGRKLPLEYVDLSQDGFVQVVNDTLTHLTVTFWPLDFDYPIVYFEAPDDSNSNLYPECSNDYNFNRKLDDHWRLCYRQPSS